MSFAQLNNLFVSFKHFRGKRRNILYSVDNIYVVTLASLTLDTETNVLFSGSIRYSTILSIKAAECAVRSKLSILRTSKIRGEVCAAKLPSILISWATTQ